MVKMITKDEYYNLKEYYDHQRLRVYNKEKVYNDIKEFLDRVDKMTKEEGEPNPLEHSLEAMVDDATAGELHSRCCAAGPDMRKKRDDDRALAQVQAHTCAYRT